LQIIREILTQKPQLYFMEGIKNIFLPAFKKIESLLPQLGALDGANLVYLTSGLAGTNFSNMKNLPGVVSRKAARGVLYDLGVYLISASLSWFGKPVQVNYTAKLVDHPDGADYFGRGRLIYPTFNVDFLVGNKTSSQTVSEIYGSEATLVLDRPTHLEKLTLLRNDQKAVTMSSPKLTNTMIPEVKHFVEMVMKQNRKEMWRLFELTTTSTTILQTMRDSAGIEFQ
ncbi:Gfo/Idh/MocA family oxidoreductase, partial [Liquorilactobacillus capillatus]